MYFLVVTVGTVQQVSIETGVGFIPRVAYKGKYYTICKHFFEDDNNGAIAVCKALGFPDGYTTKREMEGDSLHSIRVGQCKPGELKLDKCTGGGNAFGDLDAGNGQCHTGKWVASEVICTGAVRRYLKHMQL